MTDDFTTAALSEIVATPEGAADTTEAAEAAQWKHRKGQEEYDVVKAKLVHQEFKPADFPDPLLPRSGKKPTSYVQFSPEAEQHLKDIIKAAKAGN